MNRLSQKIKKLLKFFMTEENYNDDEEDLVLIRRQIPTLVHTVISELQMILHKSTKELQVPKKQQNK